MVLLSVLVVVYDEFEAVTKCIDSIYKDVPYHLEIILVHNPSGKKGINDVLLQHPNVKYIENKKNVGFGKGVNIGFKKAKGKYILILTPDTRILKGTILNTLEYIEKHKDVALVGCRVYSHPKKLTRSAFYDYPNIFTHFYEYNMIFYKIVHKFIKDYCPTLYPKIDHRKILTPKHVVGAYLLLRKSAIRKEGIFDERFFLYREETDLCKRLYDNGWKVKYLPIGGVIHYGGGSSREIISQCSPYYLMSTYIFFRKHYGSIYVIFSWMVGLFSSLMSIPFLFLILFARTAQKKSTQSSLLIRCWFKIVFWHFKLLPTLVKEI